MIQVSKLHAATEIFHYMLDKGVVGDIIRFMPELDSRYTNIPSMDIYRFFVEFERSESIEVKLYTQNRWKYYFDRSRNVRVLGYINPEDYLKININSRYFHSRGLASIVGSIAHEMGHCLENWTTDAIDYEAMFNHGSNSSIGKDRTFQYLLGNTVKQYVETNKDEIIRNTRCLRGRTDW